LDFSNIKPKIESKATQSLKTKKANKEKQWKYFWSFCVLESRNRNKNNKEKKAKHGYTKYRQNMIYIDECIIGVPPPKLRLLA
jgi:hypothetical protein